MVKIPKVVEDIYPLTIVKMRYTENVVILNYDSDNDIVFIVQQDEDFSYHTAERLEAEDYVFGMGKTIEMAFEDYKKRLLNTIVKHEDFEL